MAHTKSSSTEVDIPVDAVGMSWPSWRWLDEMFHDGEWRQTIKIEQCSDAGSMVVRAELPGVDPEKDVRVEVLDGSLVISAQKTESEEKNSPHFHRSEFRYGSLTRSIPVPKGVDESNISATYRDGVLEVRMALPKVGVSEDSTHRIEVKRG